MHQLPIKERKEKEKRKKMYITTWQQRQTDEVTISIQFKFICIALFTIQSLQSALQEIKFLQYIYTL